MTARKTAAPKRLPLWLKCAWTLWLPLWSIAYYGYYGPTTFLWLCDIGNFVLAVALWSESSLLFSWQAVSVLLVQSLWTVDYALALLTGTHFVGGTEYMFDPQIPFAIRSLSWFHGATPPVLCYGLLRLGYDRRALGLQALATSVVLPISYLFGPDRNLNWVFGPFDRVQTLAPSWLYLAVCMVAYPLLLGLPVHWLLRRWPGTRAAPLTGASQPD